MSPAEAKLLIREHTDYGGSVDTDKLAYAISRRTIDHCIGSVGIRELIGLILHYPTCWDTAAFPTLESAILEALADNKCTECT